MKKLTTVLVAALGVAPLFAQDAALMQQPHDTHAGGVIGFKDVPYQVLPGFHPQTADIYVPTQGTGPFPAVLYAHGGGFAGGSPRTPDTVSMLTGLAQRGYVVLGINYRFHGEAKFPAQIQDTKAAIRWLRSNATLYSVDRSRIGIWGGSAGGYLAALAGTSCGAAALAPPPPAAARVDGPLGMPSPGPGGVPGPMGPPGRDVKIDVSQSDCVQAVVDWFGPINFLSMDGQALPNSMKHGDAGSAESQLLGCTLTACPAERVMLTNPINYIDKDDPPFLIMHGDNDRSVPPGQSSELHRALTAKGVKATLVMVPGVDHVWIGATPAKIQEIWNTTYDFFDRTLGKR